MKKLITYVVILAGLLFALNTKAQTIAGFTPSAGPVGTLVNITGSSLNNPTAFSIGGTSAIVISNTGSTLVGMVMPGAVTGAVSITTTGGPANGPGNFTVTPTIPPTEQQSKLVGTGVEGSFIQQGSAVAVSADGNTAIVGGKTDHFGTGAAWVFTRSGGVWSQQGSKLLGTGDMGSNVSQGYSVAINADGNTVVVGGPNDDFGLGAIWVFTRSGGVWSQQGAKLAGSGNIGAGNQGSSVSISADGNTLIEGAPYDNSGRGASWIFTRSGGVWTQVGSKIVSTGAVSSSPREGQSVAMSADGKTALIGADGDDTPGATWVYILTGGVWVQQSKLVGTDNVSSSQQGQSVALSADGNTALIGGPLDSGGKGAVWVFTRSGGVWTQQGSKLVGTDAFAFSGAAQGTSVSISADGDIAIVGGPNDEFPTSGSAWIFTRSGGAWSQLGNKIGATGAVGNASQGGSVSISANGSTFVMGGNLDDSGIGAAWVFTVPPPPPAMPPTVMTNPPMMVTDMSADLGGNVMNDGGSPVTERGVVYGPSPNPETSGPKVPMGAGTGFFQAPVFGLSASTTYHFRAYAINSEGTSYGSDEQFTTSGGGPAMPPTVMTNPPMMVTDMSADLGGNVMNDGGSPLTERGVVYGPSPNPETSGPKVPMGAGTGFFQAPVFGLSASTTYHFRAYAINSEGTSYGSDEQFTTSGGGPAMPPTVMTNPPMMVTDMSADLGGDVMDDGGSPVTEKGVVYGPSPNPETSGPKVPMGAGTGFFQAPVFGLSAGTTYHYRAYAINGAGTFYGSDEQFTTSGGGPAMPPTVMTNPPMMVTNMSADLGGNVMNDGGSPVTERGVVYGPSPNPETSGPKVPMGAGTGFFQAPVFGLSPGTTYHYRAYAINGAGTFYGSDQQFTTSGGGPAMPPTVMTNPPMIVTNMSADLGGNVMSDGGSPVTERGVVYGTSPDPETSGPKVTMGSGTGFFSQGVFGLSPGTTYHYRAYAINGAGTFYGSDQQFTTTGGVPAMPPTVMTDAPSAITTNSAQLGGNVINDGGAPVTEKGVVYSTSPNPTTAGPKWMMGGGAGPFSQPVGGLTTGTQYYVRAYAINSAGTSYGGEMSFSTAVLLATVSTSTPINITSTSADLGGNVMNDGGAAVTERGIVYSLSPDPTTANNKVPNGSGTGSFSQTVGGLSPGLSYHVRAYAINSGGTSYGNDMPFNTPILANISTNSPNTITGTSANLGGNVLTDGGSPVTERGIVYGTSADPTTANTKVPNGSGLGSYSQIVTGLNPGTNYHVRAYAINAAGTSYGGNQPFTTASLASITTNTPTGINATSASLGGNITSDGGSSVTERGVVYSLSPNPTTANSKQVMGSGQGSYSQSVGGLSSATTYYVRAYAINSVGTSYGNQQVFSTPSSPTVTTAAPGSVTSNSATLGGTVTSDGGSGVMERGIVYGPTLDPTTANTKITMGGGTGSYSQTLSSFSPSTLYHVRAYAINSVGTSYGSDLTFTTTAALPPTITSFTPSGLIGSLISVSGTNLSNVTSFSIGGTQAIVISAFGGTGLTGLVMPGTTGGQVSITTLGGTVNSAASFSVSTQGVPNVQQGNKLVGTSASGAAQQGYSLALSADGNTAIVGAKDDDGQIGAAWIFVRSGGVWSQQGSKLVGSGAMGVAGQGVSVGMSADGNTAIVGGLYDNGATGAAWIFQRTGGTWSQNGPKLVGSGNSGTGQQGWAVGMSADGNTAVIGAGNDGGVVGAIWIFTRSSGTWSQQGPKLVGTGGVGQSRQGYSVAISADGNTVLSGGDQDDGLLGAVWVFKRSGVTWSQEGSKLVGGGASGGVSRVGTSVALSANGNTAITGGLDDNSGAGAAWIFTRSGITWTQQGSKLVGMGNTGNAFQGISVSLSADGNTALVGGSADDGNKGAAWLFKRSGVTWSQQGSKLVGTGASGTARQGFSVALSLTGTTALLGGTSDAGVGASWAFISIPPPTIFTSLVSLSPISAGLGGNITMDNGSPVTERGVVYGLVANPTVSDSKVVMGSGIGMYSQTISGLSPATNYHVRAYAINAGGTTYGPNLPFSTLPAFPYSESFAFSSAPGMILGGAGTASLTGGTIDPEAMGYLRLTNSAPNQIGFARGTIPFPTANGLSISFEYYSHTGNGGDGLSFFLYDASANPFQSGAAGGSLGYAQTSNGSGSPGVSKGYLAVGLDQLGNFSNPIAGRQGGPGLKPSSVVLRGDGNGPGAGTPAGSNYEYLTGIQTSSAAGMTAAGAGTPFQIAGQVNGRSTINVARQHGGLIPTDNGYRAAKIQMVPNGLGTGFIINVWIMEGTPGGGNIHHVITDYNYISTGGVPTFLSYGFSAASGSTSNIYEIRNVDIVVPEGAALAPMVMTFPKTGSKNTVIPFTPFNFDSRFSSPLGNPLVKVKVLSLPPNGVLKLGEVNISVNQEINRNDLANMKFVPNNNYTGPANFQWNGSDGSQYAAVSAFVAMTVLQSGSSVFPYTESFKNSTAAGLILGGTPSASLTGGGTDAAGAGYLRLTNNLTAQLGFARNTTSFPTSDGLSISFEYYSYGGTGADGISFFLYDAAANGSFQIGAPGGSLGYAQNSVLPGLSKGHIGFGFDEFGGFSTGTGGRMGGPGQRYSSVTIRGDGNGTGSGFPGGSNYEYLTNIQTSSAPAMFAAGAGNIFQVAGGVNGRTGGAGGLTGVNPGYRKARIELTQGGNSAYGYLVNVWITEGSAAGPIEHHVVTDLNYSPSSGVPAYVSYGFAGATGGYTNYHEVRNLEITVPGGINIPLIAATDYSIAGNDKLSVWSPGLAGTPGAVQSALTAGDKKDTASGTILPAATNVLSPNSDGKNDTWVIRNIEKYPTNIVTVVDRNGRVVYRKENYKNDWDGTFRGAILPAETYYYIVEFGKGVSPLRGFISVVR